MTAFSEQDLADAFVCAGREDLSNSLGAIESRVMAHLKGTCTCQVGRCDGCGKRATNGIPRHAPGCKFRGGK